MLNGFHWVPVHHSNCHNIIRLLYLTQLLFFGHRTQSILDSHLLSVRVTNNVRNSFHFRNELRYLLNWKFCFPGVIIWCAIIELLEYLDGLLIIAKGFLASLNLKTFQIYPLLSLGFIADANYLHNKFNFLLCEVLMGRVFDSSIFNVASFENLF